MDITVIQNTIYHIRGMQVMLDYDLAAFYGVKTKVLNQAVKRSITRFPIDFMFQLSTFEKEELVTKCDHLKTLKFSSSLPYAFTEQGVATLSSILKSPKAVMTHIAIMRAFVTSIPFEELRVNEFNLA